MYSLEQAQSQLMVRAVVAGVTKDYSIVDIHPQMALTHFNIGDPQIVEVKKGLYDTLFGRNRPSFSLFSDEIHIYPQSTVAGIAQNLATLAKGQNLAQRSIENPSQYGTEEEIKAAAVRVALARTLPNYSFVEIQPQEPLETFGLKMNQIPILRQNLLDIVSASSYRRKDLEELDINPSSTVDGIAFNFSLPGRTKPAGKGSGGHPKPR